MPEVDDERALMVESGCFKEDGIPSDDDDGRFFDEVCVPDDVFTLASSIVSSPPLHLEFTILESSVIFGGGGVDGGSGGREGGVELGGVGPEMSIPAEEGDSWETGPG